MAMAADQLIKCAECGTTFVWTTGEQVAETRPPHCPMCRRLAPGPGRRRGVVKWFSRAKGYGFITPAEGADVFVHKSALTVGQPYPRAGQLVEFAVGHGPRGAQAEELTVLEADVSSAG
jgi:CspA family cold shock protein